MLVHQHFIFSFKGYLISIIEHPSQENEHKDSWLDYTLRHQNEKQEARQHMVLSWAFSLLYCVHQLLKFSRIKVGVVLRILNPNWYYDSLILCPSYSCLVFKRIPFFKFQPHRNGMNEWKRDWALRWKQKEMGALYLLGCLVKIHFWTSLLTY